MDFASYLPLEVRNVHQKSRNREPDYSQLHHLYRRSGSKCAAGASNQLGPRYRIGERVFAPQNSENSKANRIETMKGPAESGQICSAGRRKIAKKIAKNKRCYANTLRPRSRMLLKVMKGG
jgi:hypothetical protein